MKILTEAEKREHKNLVEADITERIAKCSENLKAKNPKISPETVTSLCETLNGILRSPNKRDIPENLDSLLHEWFNDISLLEEIYKAINSKDLCFLHPVGFDFGKKMFFLRKHWGRKGEEGNVSVSIDFEKYYNDQIKGCESNLMAFEMSYRWPDSYIGHSTMVVIEGGDTRSDGKQLIEVEHFDSSNIDGEIIKAPLENFIKSVFGEEKFYFRFHHQDEVCDFNIQGTFFNETDKFSGSCTQFALWYGFKRLLEPYKSRIRVVAEMKKLLATNTPDEVMMILIKQFQSLLSIKTAENSDLNMQANGRDLYLVNKKHRAKYEQLYYQQRVNEFEKKIKKYEDLLDYISKSKSETDWEEASDLMYELSVMYGKIQHEFRGISESAAHLNTKKNQLNRKFSKIYITQLIDNGFKPFREKLEQYEDALSRCKTSSSKEICELADTLQVECGDFADNAKSPTYGEGEPLIKNKAIADLVTKYERLFQEHTEMKNPTIFNNPKKGGGKNTKRKRRQNRKRKSAKNGVKSRK